jgi:hypothetical protein
MMAAHPILRLVVAAYRPMQMRGLMLDGRLPTTHQVDERAGSSRHARRISLMAVVAAPISRYFTKRRSPC